jgi:hypothetical protein
MEKNVIGGYVVSIISVVFVPEGIAMAADSRLTGVIQHPDGIRDRFTISDNSQKLFLLNKSQVGISCCGEMLIKNKTIGDFIRSFEIDCVDENDSVPSIALKLQKYLIQQNPSSQTSFYVAGYDKDVPFVFAVGAGFLINNNSSENEYNFIFNGEVEAFDKLINGNKPTILDYFHMPLKDAMDLAEFVVELTIKYQRFETRVATCGGPIDLLVITKDYAKFVKHKILNP